MNNNQAKQIEGKILKQVKDKILSYNEQFSAITKSMPEKAKQIKKISALIEEDYSLVYELERLTKELKEARELRIRIRNEIELLENNLKELEKENN